VRTGPLRVALTGGIATGKSYCLEKFAELGAATIDADTLARQAVAPGTAGFEAVRSRFGSAILTPDGGLDRNALGRLVFANTDALRALEAIIHPTVYAAIERWFASASLTGQRKIAIAAIPLLYETGRESDFDRVIATICAPDQQVDRLMLRSALTAEEAGRRIAAQMPAAEKAARAAYAIDTSGTFEHTDRQVEEIWARLDALSA
jgi:dephospho-CoA kinase